MADKKPHKIMLSFDENKRNELLEAAKFYSFEKIWAEFYNGEPGNEVKAIQDFKKFINEEIRAIDYAHDPENGSHKESYKNITLPKNKKQNGKTPAKKPREKTNSVASKFFEAQDKFSEDSYLYGEYLTEVSAAESIEDEAERKSKLAELESEYKGAIDAFNNCQNAYKDFEKYEQTMRFLNEVPEEVLANMVSFHLKCKEAGKEDLAEKAFEDMCSKPEYMPRVKNGENREIENEHRYRISDGVVTQSIRNLNGTGLDLTFTDGEYSIVFCDNHMTKEQVDALADYCFRYGINIKNFGDLKGSKVVDNENNELGELESVFDTAMKEAEKNNSNENHNTSSANQGTESVNSDENYFGDFIPKGKPIKELDSQKAVDAAQMLTAGGGVVDPSYGFDTITVRMYASEEDKEKDLIVDSKGKVQRTKKYSVTINRRTGKAKYYLGNKTKLETGDIRVTLKAFKDQGYKYFEYPSVTSKKGFGVGTQKSMFEASVKEGMPLLLRGPSGRGCDIGASDIDTIIELSNKPENFNGKTNDKIEYFMRWHEQVVKYAETTGKQTEFAAVKDKLKLQAIFANQLSYTGAIDAKIKEGQKDKKWTELDDICATMALTSVLKDIKDGKLKINPLDPKSSEIIANRFEMHLHNGETRKELARTIAYNVKVLSAGVGKEQNKLSAAISAVAKKQKEALDEVLADYKLSGVDISYRPPSSGIKYSMESKAQQQFIHRAHQPAFKRCTTR